MPFAAPELLGGAAAADVATIGAEGAGAAFDLGTIGPGVAADAGALSGLTSADVSFLDPTLFGEAAAPGAVPPTPGALPLTSGGMIDPTAIGPGAPGAIPGAETGSFDLGTLGPGAPGAGGPLDLSGGAPGAVTGAPQAGGGDVLSKIGTFMGSPAGKGLGTVAGLGGLSYNLLQGAQQKKALDALNARESGLAAEAAATAAAAKKSAQPLLTSGDTLMSYLTTNTLPPQFQAMIDKTIAANKASIIQGYTSRGMSGDPKQNSALNQDLMNVDQQADVLKGNLESTLSTAGNQMVQTANQLLSTGLSATQLSAEIPIQMAKLNVTLNAQMTTAISNFAAALNGGNRGGGVQAPQNVVGQSGTLNFG